MGTNLSKAAQRARGQSWAYNHSNDDDNGRDNNYYYITITDIIFMNYLVLHLCLWKASLLINYYTQQQIIF